MFGGYLISPMEGGNLHEENSFPGFCMWDLIQAQQPTKTITEMVMMKNVVMVQMYETILLLNVKSFIFWVFVGEVLSFYFVGFICISFLWGVNLLNL